MQLSWEEFIKVSLKLNLLINNVLHFRAVVPSKLGLVFLLFDLEITLVFPFAVSQSNNEIYGLIVVLIFLVIITIGFVYELGKGALKIDSKQSISLSSSTSTITSISYIEKSNTGN
uniref:NADH-ubiquinone oxidoreductase chain 3 n=1 Tax=Cryphonectria parasitica TaxID=5116 RepID=A0A191MX93_CRYPA|nr:NADH dehydrogenase subunit 3 [Cryphonectria parasitica]